MDDIFTKPSAHAPYGKQCHEQDNDNEPLNSSPEQHINSRASNNDGTMNSATEKMSNNRSTSDLQSIEQNLDALIKEIPLALSLVDALSPAWVLRLLLSQENTENK